MLSAGTRGLISAAKLAAEAMGVEVGVPWGAHSTPHPRRQSPSRYPLASFPLRAWLAASPLLGSSATPRVCFLQLATWSHNPVVT